MGVTFETLKNLFLTLEETKSARIQSLAAEVYFVLNGQKIQNSIFYYQGKSMTAKSIILTII